MTLPSLAFEATANVASATALELEETGADDELDDVEAVVAVDVLESLLHAASTRSTPASAIADRFMISPTGAADREIASRGWGRASSGGGDESETDEHETAPLPA